MGLHELLLRISDLVMQDSHNSMTLLYYLKNNNSDKDIFGQNAKKRQNSCFLLTQSLY